MRNFMQLGSRLVTTWWFWAFVLLALAGLPGAARAQFAAMPGSALGEPPAPSQAPDEQSYRKDAAEDGWKRMLAWFKKHGV